MSDHISSRAVLRSISGFGIEEYWDSTDFAQLMADMADKVVETEERCWDLDLQRKELEKKIFNLEQKLNRLEIELFHVKCKVNL